jgi:deoxyxylulose-5-phosphate synthase
MQVVGLVPFASTFAAFLTRAYDFIRMAAISRASVRLCGSHAGVSIGEDGPSQMALEDLAMMRAVHGSTVFYPCDANQTARLVGRHGRPARHRLPPDDAREDADPLHRPARRLPRGRQPHRPLAPTATSRSRSSPPASPCTRRSRPPTSSGTSFACA